MKLVFLNPVGVVGGAERVLLACIRAAVNDGQADVHLVLLGSGPLQSAAEALGARVHVVPLPDRLAGMGDTQLRARARLATLARLGWSSLRAIPAGGHFLFKLRTLLRSLQPDLLHSHGLKTHLLTALARPRHVPVLWHLHDFYSERPLMAKMLRRARRGVVGAVAISAAVRDDAQRVLPGLPISVILNAVDTNHFTPQGSSIDLDSLANLPARAGLIRAGLVATYANWKGHHTFLEALARARKSVPHLRGYIIGGPIYATAGSQVTRDELEATAREFGLGDAVGFVPFQTDPAAVYRALDIVVHASTRAEPFGLTIAEGMSCGRAVIVSAAGGARELFEDGVTALGHIPGDVAGLASALQRLACEDGFRQHLGTAARIAAETHFSFERFSRELIHLNQQLVPATPGSSSTTGIV